MNAAHVVRDTVTREGILAAVERECGEAMQHVDQLPSERERALVRCTARLIYRGVVEQVCVRPGQPQQTLVREAQQ